MAKLDSTAENSVTATANPDSIAANLDSTAENSDVTASNPVIAQYPFCGKVCYQELTLQKGESLRLPGAGILKVNSAKLSAPVTLSLQGRQYRIESEQTLTLTAAEQAEDFPCLTVLEGNFCGNLLFESGYF